MDKDGTRIVRIRVWIHERSIRTKASLRLEENHTASYQFFVPRDRKKSLLPIVFFNSLNLASITA